MNSNISADYYFKEDVFIREKETIFKNNWLFVGFRKSLEKNNDFITRTIVGVPVVIQNFNGEIKAFLNVCSHRFSLIQCAEEGNRAMMCPYHGWAYNHQGIPTGIPQKPLFKDFSKEELFELRLKEFKVATCGELVFISLNPNVSLEVYLDKLYGELETISRSMGEQVDKNPMRIEANWKVIVENTLESYHVNLIHADTFKKLGAKGNDFKFDGYHSVWDAGLEVQREDKANKKIDSLFEDREFKIDGYRHIIIFPALLISTTHGTSYNFSYIEPVSPDETNFISYVFTAKTSANASKSLLNAFNNMLTEFNRAVFAEDKVICEFVQKGLKHTTQQGVLSLIENRVHHFQNVYKELMA